jgi:hypothetical protein
MMPASENVECASPQIPDAHGGKVVTRKPWQPAQFGSRFCPLSCWMISQECLPYFQQMASSAVASLKPCFAM